RHRVATVGEPGEMRAGPARDVEHPAHGPSRIALEAVDEEVDLALPVHVERDLVEARGAVLVGQGRPHQASMASRITHDAVIPVRPLGSHTWATSTRSPPTTRHRASEWTMSTNSAARIPHGSGEPVPGASLGSRTSTSIVT